MHSDLEGRRVICDLTDVLTRVLVLPVHVDQLVVVLPVDVLQVRLVDPFRLLRRRYRGWQLRHYRWFGGDKGLVQSI